MMAIAWRVRLALDAFTWRHKSLRKWRSIAYVSHTKGFSFLETVHLWNQAEREWPLGDGNPDEWASQNETEYFFELAAHEEYERAEYYRCVEGCCTVIWSNGHNSGGYGPAGCPCDRLEDPRGEKINA